MDRAANDKATKLGLLSAVLALCCMTVIFLMATRALATGVGGFYIMIDPYNMAELPALNAAAMATTCAGAEPFCTDSNGILLTVDWCRYEGYQDAEAPPATGGGRKDFSCHYAISYTNQNNRQTPTQTYQANEDTHQCPLPTGMTAPTTDFDECSSSDLSVALHDIAAINALRARAGKSALRMSLGLVSGSLTPEAYLLDTTHIMPQPIAFTQNTGNPKTNYICALEPTVWEPTYVAAYLRAYDELITYVASVVGIAQLKLVKVTPTTALTLEYFLPGFFIPRSGIFDPTSPYADDVIVNCSSSQSSADTWNSVYQNAPIPGLSVQQAIEKTFGSTVGNLYATLKVAGATNFGLSLPTNNGEALPEIICGVGGNGGPGNQCNLQTLNGDQWSIYYFFLHVADLFPSPGTSPDPVALAAAKAASLAVNINTPFALTNSNFFVNTTNLADPTPACAPPDGPVPYCIALSQASLACDLNETSTANIDEGRFVLNGAIHYVTGVGTSLGIQTNTGLNNPQTTDYCTAPAGSVNLGTIFNYAISNGSQFIEATPDIANDPTCRPYFHSALVALTSQMATNCLY